MTTFPINDALKKYRRLNRERFHMPGHHGNPVAGFSEGVSAETLAVDLTELDGLDVLSEPEECILESQKQAAQTFGVGHSFYLINGSSTGIMAAMMSTLKPGDKILIPRNVHRAVLSGLILTGAEPVWLLPEYLQAWGVFNAINPEKLEAEILKHKGEIKAFILASPTYDGIGSDTVAVAEICKKYDICFLVDEAHGSLWPFSEQLPLSACQLYDQSKGTVTCDFVVHSLHKSGGSLTQTAIAHLPKGSQINPDLFQQSLNILQSTSPSYVFMASLDHACGWLATEESQLKIEQNLKFVSNLRQEFSSTIHQFELYQPYTTAFWDFSRLLVRHKNSLNTLWAEEIETEQQLAYESLNGIAALYLTGIGLTEGMCENFIRAYKVADAKTYSQNTSTCNQLAVKGVVPNLPNMATLPRTAYFSPSEKIAKQNAIGRIARETIVHCPPGIPVLIHGEAITQEHLPYLPECVEVVLTVDR